MTVAASAMAERKTFRHLSQRVATRLQSLSLLNMISITAQQCIAQQCHERAVAPLVSALVVFNGRHREESGKFGHLLVGRDYPEFCALAW